MLACSRQDAATFGSQAPSAACLGDVHWWWEAGPPVLGTGKPPADATVCWSGTCSMRRPRGCVS